MEAQFSNNPHLLFVPSASHPPLLGPPPNPQRRTFCRRWPRGRSHTLRKNSDLPPHEAPRWRKLHGRLHSDGVQPADAGAVAGSERPWRVLAGGAAVAPFEVAHGEDIWSYASANLAHSQLINGAMVDDARVAVPALIEGCPELLKGIGSLVDVGGGDGTALSLMVKAWPWIRGINFDLPHVVAVAPEVDGVEHIGGDMFECVPKADSAFIMWVLHDWGDDECIQILRKCKEAIPKDKGKVIIVDAVIEEGKEDRLTYVRLMLDMAMMAHTKNGKERSLEEWDYVLKEAGFSRYTIKRIQAVQSLIEAYP